MSIKLLALVSALIFLSCSNNNSISKSRTIKYLDLLSKNDHKVRLDNDLTIISATLLKFDTASPIDVVTNLIKTDQNFIFTTTKDVFKYSLAGDPILKFGNRGRGPGEYIGISDICYDFRNNDLYIFSSDDRNLLSYSASNGDLKSETRLPSNGLEIAFNSKYFVLYVSQNGIVNLKDNILLLDKSGSIISSSFSYANNVITTMTTMSGFLVQDNKHNIQFAPSFSDTIYELVDKAFVPKYHCNLGPDMLHTENYENFDQFLSNYMHETFLSDIYFESDRLLIVFFHHELRRKFAIYLKDQDKLMLSDYIEIDPYCDVIGSANCIYIANESIFVMPASYFYEKSENVSFTNQVLGSDQITLNDSPDIVFELKLLSL